MIYAYNKDLKNVAQKLRREMTKEERHLWYDFLKLLPITVNRQKNIGNYIVDFFIASKRIVIEIDGWQHGEPEQREKDQRRDDDFERLGITVLRYTNRDVNCKFQAVCADIAKHLEISI